MIDDSLDTGKLLQASLTTHEVTLATSAQEALKMIQESQFDLFLIDVLLPDGNGFDLCLSLSTNPALANTPRIILTAKDQVAEKVYGFSCGADDYMTKPFSLVELKARIDRNMQRSSERLVKEFSHPPFFFNLEFLQCSIVNDGQKRALDLTPTEFRLFLSLVRNQGHVLTREEIEQAVWKQFNTAIELRGIDTHIAHLRQKLGEFKGLIVSVYGRGYSFNDKNGTEAA